METNATTLWSLRPAGEHAGLRRAAQAAGLRLRALPLQRLVAREAGAALAAALVAPIRLYTSPAAVRFAAMQADLRRPGLDIAVGSGTAAALRRAGAAAVLQPERMDSEGVLGLPALQAVGDQTVGLVTAPGGRGLIPQVLGGRGARLVVAEVYARCMQRGGARRLAAFVDDQGAVLLASSAEALALLCRRLPAAGSPRGDAVRARPLVLSSPRLAERAAAEGFRDRRVARGPSPAALVAAALTPTDLQ